MPVRARGRVGAARTSLTISRDAKLIATSFILALEKEQVLVFEVENIRVDGMNRAKCIGRSRRDAFSK